jgi:hypothetical protein
MSSAPDVGSIVEYGLNSFGTGPAQYRVTAYACPSHKHDRLRWCTQSEATHVALTGICGAMAPIELCKVVGMVDWEAGWIEEARQGAQRLADSRGLVG